MVGCKLFSRYFFLLARQSMKKDEAGCLGMQSTELDFNHSTIAKGLCLAFIYLFIYFTIQLAAINQHLAHSFTERSSLS